MVEVLSCEDSEVQNESQTVLATQAWWKWERQGCPHLAEVLEKEWDTETSFLNEDSQDIGKTRKGTL